jgi:hypothetical protein
MKKIYLGFLVLTAIWSACRNSTGTITKKCGPCPMYAEVLPVVGVRMVSKTTGADLILASNSPYKPSDLKVSSSISGPGYHFIVDTSNTSTRGIWIPSPESQTFTLQLANLGPDNIKVVALRDSPVCCPRLRIKSIVLDDSLLCSPCSLGQVITIRK